MKKGEDDWVELECREQGTHRLIYDCECVMVDEDDNILDEASVRQWKKTTKGRVMKYRCLSGPKKGRLVSKPGGCATRKDPKRKCHI